MKKAVTCAQCGTKMRAGIKFCSKCGYRLRDEAAEALAEAALAEEAAANFLTEEEVAALNAPEAAPEVEEAADATVAAVEEAPAEPVVEEAPVEVVEEAVATEAAPAESAAVKKHREQTDRQIARLESKADASRLAAEDSHRLESARITSASAGKASAARIAESRKMVRTSADTDVRDAARAARAERQEVEERAFESRVADIQQNADLALTKRREKEAFRAEKKELAARDAAFSAETKKARARAKALRAEDKKAAKYHSEEGDFAVQEKTSENRLLAGRVSMEKARLKQQTASDERMQRMQHQDELRTAKRVAAEREKATRALMQEEAKIADRANDGVKKDAEEKAFDNRLYAKQAAAEKKTRKRREADMQRTVAKQAAVRERETKRLGAVEYKAATMSLTAEAAEARRRAEIAERDMEKQQQEEKLNLQAAAAEKRLIRQRAGDMQKHSRAATALRAKETRALGRAEMRALRVVKSDEVLETRRKTDEVLLEMDQKQQEDKLYAKKVAAEKRMIRTKAGDAEKLQQAEIRNQEMMREAQLMEDTRASRIRADGTKRAVADQKKQDELYQTKKTAEDRISEREHRLEKKRLRALSARDARVMSQKEREQRKNLELADRYEKDAVKRAKKISRISGVPVSLVPALSGQSSASALLTDGKGGATAPVLHDPETLLASSYESNREQYVAYKKRKKQENKRLRYVEIGIRDEKKYVNTIYENGEVMVAKRTLRVARVQAILSILLMVVALAAVLLPIYTVERDVSLPAHLYDTVLDGQGVISFESILTDGQSAGDTPIAYLQNLVSKIVGGGFFDSVKTGIGSFVTALQGAMADDVLLPHIATWVVFGFLSLGILLTPVALLLNLVVAILRLIFHLCGKGVGITRIMRNLRASYALYGFILLPALALQGLVIGNGFLILTAAFAAAVVLHLLLNLIKKYEACDFRYLTAVKLNGVIRLALLVGFFLLLQLSGVFGTMTYGTDRVKMYVAAACLGVAYIVFAFCALAVVPLAFEILGYTKGRSTGHGAMIVMGLAGGALAVVAKILVQAPISSMIYVAIIAMAAILLFTLIFAIVKKVIIKRNNLIDPILDALDEGYPIK
ncbi:MAG: hypothetical protein J6T24_05585 [Clostridia bacterium]|nr:hypothetical protein [Clostridia bacterium]